jgi:hypothetical protein
VNGACEVGVAKKRAKESKRKSRQKRAVDREVRDAKVAPSVAAALPVETPEDVREAAKRFASGVVGRGEAVDAGAPLIPGATHEIVGHDANGEPVLKRKRFSAY